MTSDSRKLVEKWIAEQPDRTPLLASTLARELRGTVKPLDIADALAKLRTDGRIRQVFAVRVPSGPVLRRTYRSVEDIEEEVRDQLNRVVPRDDLEVLPAFEKVGA